MLNGLNAWDNGREESPAQPWAVIEPLQADICDTHISPRITDYQAVQHDVCP